MKASISRSVEIKKTVRVQQVESIFDVPPSERSTEIWEVDLPLDDKPWNVGLIVGPSGSGKTTIARELFGEALCKGFEWPADSSLLDGFPESLGIKDITELLSSVGFSSPPMWLRPFDVLSTGQQMRVNVARLLSEQKQLAVMDEFSSTVDRTVAQIGSAAIAKTVRRRDQKFIAVTCHYDVTDWLQPDWVYQPASNEFLWRFPQPRPRVTLTVKRVHHSAWELFKQYHYLNLTHSTSARYFVAFLEGIPVALQSVIVTPHPHAKNLFRGHRAVCLPDYQGIGIGSSLITHVASAYKAVGCRITSTTASPALNQSRKRDPRWVMTAAPHMAKPMSKGQHGRLHNTKDWIPAINRLTTTWEYIGEAMDGQQARALIYGDEA